MCADGRAISVKAAHCRALVDRAVQTFGRIDLLVNNAAHQMSFNVPDEISDEEWERSFAVDGPADDRVEHRHVREGHLL
jgi:NAD(P)-dependent dehydrogenase (short-subunit alcohol dehydrogenase family)